MVFARRAVSVVFALVAFGFCSAPAVAALNLLFVTTNNGSYTALESGRKAQMEAYGYTVNQIWDGASQATFNTAFANNLVVYLSDEVTAADLGSKLREAPIGVFSEHPALADEMGFCTSGAGTSTSSSINVTNNTHYVTNVFSTGPLTLGSGTYTISRMNGTTASGAQVLATVSGSNSLVVVNTGATLANTYNGSNLAVGRRAHFPLPVSVNDGSTFNSNTFTLAAREIAWAAGLDATMIARWKLNETSGTSAADSTNFNYTGTVTGTASWVPGVLNNGFAFNGSTKIQATGLLGSPKNISVAAWANLTSADTNGAEIISLGDHFYLRLDEGGVVKAAMYNGSSWLTVSVSGTYAGTGWHHFAATFDDDNNSFRLYVDGVLAATATNTSSINYTGLGGNTVIGRQGNNGTNNDFTGTIDDVRVYNYAITANDVAKLYGFVGQWKLAETSGTTAADSTVFAQNGTVSGGASWITRCNGTNVFDFNGSSHYITVTNASQLQPTEMISIAAWVKGDSWGAGSDVDTILRKGDANPNNYQLAVADGKVAFYLDDSDTVGVRSTTTLVTGQWYHVAATWDGVTARVYVNGTLETSSAKSGTIGTNTLPIRIGGTSSSDYFDGSMHDVRLYNRPLSQAEITRLAGLVGYWKFSEGTGTTAADSSGLGNSATLIGATWATDCAGYGALQTNGTGGIAQTSAAFIPPDEGTVAFWMKSSGSPLATARLFGVGADWEVRQSTDGTLSFDLCGDATPDVISTIPINEVGRWYHVVETFSSANDTYAIYIDGQLNKSGTNQVTMVQQPAAVLSFGTRTGSTEYWQGALRDFRIYSRKLCPTEIAELYGLVGYWALDESSGASAADSSGLGQTGTVSGTATWTTGKVNNAFSLNGSSSISVSSQMGKPKNLTLAAWAKLTSADSGGAELISLGDTFAIRLNAGSTTQAFFYNGTSWTTVSFAQTYAGTGWHHFAAVFDDDHDYCRLYVDGVQKANVTTTASLAYTLGTNTVIGKHGNNGTTWDFTGLVDDVRVYNRPLCATDVQQLFSSGGSPGVRIIKWTELQ